MIDLKYLVTLDRWAYPVYALVSPLLSLFKRQSKTNKKEHAVIIKMLGIGSITRIITTLRRNDVDLNQIHFVTLDSNRQLCELLEVPNTIFINSGKWYGIPLSLWQALRTIRKLNPNYVVDYERSSNLLGIFRGFTTVFSDIGTVSFYQLPLDKKGASDVRFKLKDRSIARLISLTLPYLPEKTRDHSSLSDSIDRAIHNKRIFININASDYLPYRKYPPEAFAQVIVGLLEHRPDLEISLIGAVGERDNVQAMIDTHLATHFSVKNLCGKWDLKQLVKEMQKADLLITNDSGPMHLAVTYQVNTVAIWGPTTPDIFGYTNIPNVINLHSGRGCAPCFSYPKSKAGIFCNRKIDCMNDIRPAQVIEAAIKLLIQDPVTT